MITDKQFEDAFSAAGGWFFLIQYETIKTWTKSKRELVDLIYSKGFDDKRTGRNTRVSSALRMINSGRKKMPLSKSEIQSESIKNTLKQSKQQ